MNRLLIRTLLAFLAAATGSAAQEDAAARGLLAQHLPGKYASRESGTHGRSEGWCHGDVLLDGSWVRLRYRSYQNGQQLYAAEQFLHEAPDREVRAWHFNCLGQVSEWQGRADERGLVLRNFDAAGNLMSMQVFEWQQGGYEFSFLSRARVEDELKQDWSGRFETTMLTFPPVNDEAAWQRARATPFSYYLGYFVGQEQAVHGASEGHISTIPVLDGAWYLSDYQSRAGDRVVYAGLGYTLCREDGEYRTYWFGYQGDQVLLEGKLVKDGAQAQRKAANGVVIERHSDAYTEQGYRFRIETRAAESEPWSTYMEASYTRIHGGE